MAVVSLSFFNPEEVPGIPPWRLFPVSDQASYAQIWAAVRNVAYNCISEYLATGDKAQLSNLKFVSDTGWDAVGKTTYLLEVERWVRIFTDSGTIE